MRNRAQLNCIKERRRRTARLAVSLHRFWDSVIFDNPVVLFYDDVSFDECYPLGNIMTVEGIPDTRPLLEDCITCEGTGECPDCDGVGTFFGGTLKCDRCGSSGICQECQGEEQSDD